MMSARHSIFRGALALAAVAAALALLSGRDASAAGPWVLMVTEEVTAGSPAPSTLGTMVSDGSKYIPGQWWISLFPALFIVVIILGFNLLGDGVRDMLAGD